MIGGGGMKVQSLKFRVLRKALGIGSWELGVRSRKHAQRFLLFFLLTLNAQVSILNFVFAVELSPVFNARLYGGQYFFENQESNLSGNVSVTAAPAISFNPRWSLIPTLFASWRGTKSVQELVGGGTLFQQTQDHSASVKGIFSPTKLWQFKAGGGYRIQLLKETSDEKWGKGLFDFQKPSANIEVERLINEETSVRVGYDFYAIDFRNFSSLESQKRDLGRENATAKTLNTTNHGTYFAAKFPFRFLGGQKGSFETSYFFTFRNFSEQKIVLLTGDLSNDLRRDKSQIVTSRFTLPFLFKENFKMLAEIRGNYNRLSSNQNNFDASKTQFNENFYAYKEYSVGPNFNFIVGQKPYIFTAGFNYVRRNYDDRPIQDVSGTYGTERIVANEYYANFAVTYPITKNFSIQALGNLGWFRSNMKFEKTYRYNYVTSTYLMGVVYDY